MYSGSLEINEPQERKNCFDIKLKKSIPEWHNPKVKLGFVDSYSWIFMVLLGYVLSPRPVLVLNPVV